MKKLIKQTLIYYLLIMGYLYLYVIDIDQILHPSENKVVKSKVEFIYQQF